MADFQEEVSASLNQMNQVRGDNTELDDPHLGSEEPSFNKHSDPNMDPLNPFSTQHTPLASMELDHSDHGEETLTQYQSETHSVRSAESGQVVYYHDDPGDFTNDEARNQIFLDSDQSGDGPCSPSAHIGRGDEVDEIVQESIDSNPFSMEAENQNATVSSGHCVGMSRPGAGYNPFLNDDQEADMDEEDEHTDDSQEQSDGFPDPRLNGPLGSVGRGDERGVNHTYNLLEEDEEEEEVDIQMEPVENIQYPDDDEEEHLAAVSNEPQVLNYEGLIGHAEDISQCPASRYVEDLSDSSAAQRTGGISDLPVAEHLEDVPEPSPKGRTEAEPQLASAYHSDDTPQYSLLAHCEETTPNVVAEHVKEVSMMTSAGYSEDISQIVSAEHAKELSGMTSAELAEDISQITSTGHEEEDTFQTYLKGYLDDVSQLASARLAEDQSQASGYAEVMPSFEEETERFSQMPSRAHIEETPEFSPTERYDDTPEMFSSGLAADTASYLLRDHDDVPMVSSLELAEHTPESPSTGHPEDDTKFSSARHVEVVTQMSSGFITLMSEYPSTGERDDLAQSPVGGHAEDMSPISSGGLIEDIPQLSSVGHAEDVAHVSVARDVEDTFHISSGQFNEDTTYISSVEHTEEMSEIPSGGHREEMSEIPSGGHREEMSEIPSGGHREEMSEIPSGGHREDVSEILLGGHRDYVSEIPLGGHGEDVSEIPLGGHREGVSEIPLGGHREDVSEIPLRGHGDDVSEILFGGHREDVSKIPLGGHREDVSEIPIGGHMEDESEIPIGGHMEDESEIPIGGHMEDESEIPIGGHMEDESEIPSGEHAEDLPLVSMTRDLKEMTQTPSPAHADDISHVSVMKDIESITQGSSSRYLEDLSQLSSTEVGSQIPPSFADESTYSKDTTTAVQQHELISDTSDFTAHHIVPEESTQEKIRMQDSESYECLDMHTDDIDTTRDNRYEESKADDKDVCPSKGDELRDVGQEYLNDTIIGEEEEEEDEAEDNVMSKEQVPVDIEGHMMDVSDSELVVSESSCGYLTQHDHEPRDETAEELVEKENLATFEERKGVESDSEDMFIRHSYGVSQEKQMGEHEEHHDQEELKYDDDDNEDVGIRDEKGFSSRIDSDIMSSEFEDRSYVDNLSELASPDIIPQPLPSPPEPKDMSAFDPLAPCDTPSPCHEHNGELGQHGALFEQAAAVVIPDENSAPDFLASAEVEGETKFGVDGTAITSTGANDAFLHSDEDDEDDEVSQNLDQGGFTTTTTTETETSTDDRSGDFSGRGFEQAENNDNALMSMSMEGSFYDDGGELMGGDDRRNQQQTHLYEDGYITEESSQHDSYEPKQEHFVVNPDEFGQKVLSVLVQENHQTPQRGYHDIQEKEEDFDPLHSSEAPSGSSVGNRACVGGHMGDIDSLLDGSVTTQGLQQSTSEQARKVVSSVDDNVEQDFRAHKPESVVESQRREEHKAIEDSTSQGGHISDIRKIEKPSIEDATVTDTHTKTTTTPDAAATTAASVAAAGAAGDEAVNKTTTAVKKSTTKPVGKTTATTTTTTATTTKVAKETKTTNGKAATTTTIPKSSPKKHADSRPTSVATAERKTSSKAAGSPTQSAPTPPGTKTTAPLPSYAQPISHRKPREAKVVSPDEKKKKTTTATNVPRASSAAPHPRPQSVSSSTATTSVRAATRSASTVASSASRTAQLARPKSSPTKITNGIASPSADGVKSPTTKHETDSKKEEHKPRSGRKEHKATAKTDTGIKSATTPTTSAAKSPTKQASPLTLVSPKTGDIKSKIGSLENATHTPGGGHVKITHKKPNYTNVSSKIGSKDNMDYKPGGGHVKIENRKIKVEGKSKIGSLENAAHKPGGGDKKIEVQKTEWKAQSKIGSLDNAKHKPDGDKQTNGTDVEDKSLKNGLAENTGPASISEHGAAELVNGSASEI